MIPAAFDYERATSVGHAAELLAAADGEARLLAGGHSLLPLMRLRLARPDLLVDIGRLDELRRIRAEDDGFLIGALATHHAVAASAELAEGCALLPATAAQIGDPQVRHCGTIGGSAAHADPASDLPAALLALDADLVLEGTDGARTIPASEFFVGPFMSGMDPAEVLTGIRVPATRGAAVSYRKFQRRAQDWAIVGVAAVIERDGDAISRAAIGLTNMGGTPLRATAVEEALVGADDEDAVARAARAVAEIGRPPGDESASAEFRLHLAEVMIRRAVASAK